MKALLLLYLAAGLVACTPPSRPETAASQPQQEVAPVERKTTQIVAQWSDKAGLESLMTVEDTIADAGDGLYDVDGNDIGSGTFNVFIYAADADVASAVARIVKLHDGGVLPPGMKIGVAQYKDAERKDWTFKPVFPADLKSFDLM